MPVVLGFSLTVASTDLLKNTSFLSLTFPSAVVFSSWAISELDTISHCVGDDCLAWYSDCASLADETYSLSYCCVHTSDPDRPFLGFAPAVQGVERASDWYF